MLRCGELVAPLAFLVGLTLLAAAVWTVYESWFLTQGRPRGTRGALVLFVLAGVVLWTVGRAWWMAHRVADGIRLTRRDAPQLFERVSAIAQKLGARQPDRVLLTDELNASTLAAPRIVPFLRPRVIVSLGLPLFELLSPAQLDAVLAHEIGHQRPSGFGMSGRIGALVTFWETLAERDTVGTRMISSLARWYARRLSVASFAFSRQTELDCDRASVEVAGRGVASSALLRISAFAVPLLEWERDHIRAMARDENRSFGEAMAMRLPFLQSPPSDRVRAALVAALRVPPDEFSSYPSTRERYEAMSGAPIDPEVVAVPSGNPPALHVLLGRSPASCPPVARLMREVEIATRLSATGVSGGVALLDELDRQMDGEQPSPAHDARLEASIDEWLRLSYMLDPEARTIERCRRAVELRPNYGDAWAALAIGLLDEDRPDGLEAAREALRLGTAARTGVVSSLAQYHERHGDVVGAEAARRASRVSSERDDAAAQELERRPKAQRILPHELPAEVVGQIAAAARGVRGVRKVWVARRSVEHAPALQVYVLMAEPRFFTLRVRGDKDTVARELADAVSEAVPLPGPLIAYDARSLSRPVRAAFRRVGKDLLA